MCRPRPPPGWPAAVRSRPGGAPPRRTRWPALRGQRATAVHRGRGEPPAAAQRPCPADRRGRRHHPGGDEGRADEDWPDGQLHRRRPVTCRPPHLEPPARQRPANERRARRQRCYGGIGAAAVKVQYPGIAETIAADLGNVALLRRMLRVTAPSQDVDALIAELRERVLEELDYRREADNQRLLAAYFDGHPTIHVPGIIGELSTRRIVTSELATGARFSELASWSQEERDLAAETIYRFVFRSLYEVHAFNGDPHPGNYLFHGGGRVTFLDFGLVKHFSPNELQPLMQMARHLCVDNDPEAFRRSMEKAGFLRPDAPLSTETIVEHMGVFYETIRERGALTITGDYASAVVRRFFDVRSPVAEYVSVPRSYVILQRINLGLFAVLGELSATADWRTIAEEIWPFVQGPPSTPTGEAEAAWRAGRRSTTMTG